MFILRVKTTYWGLVWSSVVVILYSLNLKSATNNKFWLNWSVVSTVLWFFEPFCEIPISLLLRYFLLPWPMISRVVMAISLSLVYLSVCIFPVWGVCRFVQVTLFKKNIVYSILMKQNDRSLSAVQLSFEPTNRAGTTLSCKAVEVRESLLKPLPLRFANIPSVR